MRIAVLTLSILVVAFGFLLHCLIEESEAKFLAQKAFEECRGQYEALARTIGKGVDSAYTCKSKRSCPLPKPKGE